MESSLQVYCPRCPGSTQPYFLDELREHVANNHLKMASLYNCPQCQAGFIFPQTALNHFRFVCCLQQHYETTVFTKNLLFADCSVFKELSLVETEAIRNAFTPPSVPLALFAENEEVRLQKNLHNESDGRNSPQSALKEPKTEPCDTIVILTTQKNEKPLKDCPVSSRTSKKRDASPDSRTTTKRQDEKPVEKKTRLSSSGYQQSRLDEVNNQKCSRPAWNHACEYENCCDPNWRRGCDFCNGFHASRDCATVINFEERRMILRSKGICTTCGKSHLSISDPCRKIKCKHCSTNHCLWFYCTSSQYQRHIDYLESRKKMPPSIEILKCQVERSLIFNQERQKERRLR